jgi:hypothetical protein
VQGQARRSTADDVEVVLDDDDAVALVHETMEDIDSQAGVSEKVNRAGEENGRQEKGKCKTGCSKMTQTPREFVVQVALRRGRC